MTSQLNDSDHIRILVAKGNTIFGKVVYAETAKDSPDVLNVVTDVWLGPYQYEAIFATNHLVISGLYMPFAYELTEDQKWLFYGTFTRTPKNTRHHFPGRTFVRTNTHRLATTTVARS